MLIGSKRKVSSSIWPSFFGIKNGKFFDRVLRVAWKQLVARIGKEINITEG